jgi:hypothetical protein
LCIHFWEEEEEENKKDTEDCKGRANYVIFFFNRDLTCIWQADMNWNFCWDKKQKRVEFFFFFPPPLYNISTAFLQLHFSSSSSPLILVKQGRKCFLACTRQVPFATWFFLLHHQSYSRNPFGVFVLLQLFLSECFFFGFFWRLDACQVW